MMIPEGVTFLDWAHSLIVDFSSDNVPALMDEDNWKLWGNLLIERDSFAINAAPHTSDYEDKWKWARDVYSTMTNF